MDEHRLGRALAWAGAGGAVVAAGTLLVSALYATTPDGSSPVAQLRPCFSPNCSSSTTVPVSTPAAPAHVAAPKAATPSPKAVPEVNVAVKTPASWSNPVPAIHLGAPVVAMASADGSLVMVGSDGGVFPIGRAGFYGSLGGKTISSSIVAAGVDPQTGGYWLAGADGSVFALNAPFYGSLGRHHPVAAVTGMAVTPAGDGYWLVTSAGSVFAFGAARYYGSPAGPRLKSKIVDIEATPDGKGYWLVSEAGGVYAFGDAGYFGSLGGHHPASPIVAMAVTPTGLGYRLVSSGGGVFAYGDATFEGRAMPVAHQVPISAIVSTPTGAGYWLADQTGEVLSYGDAVQVTSTVHPQAHKVAPPVPARPAVGGAHPPRAKKVSTDLVKYSGGAAGLDISQYQCGNIPSTPTAVAVVQVTGGGLDEAPNSCYGQEAAWAGSNLSAYIYMDGLPTPAPAIALNGPQGHCKGGMFACQSYNYGYNEVAYYVSYSHRLGINPKLWWLDVERYSNWGAQGANALIIRGALDALAADHVKSGVYSTAPQWNEITGGMAIPGESEWAPGAGQERGGGYTATGFCAAPGTYTFGGGKLELVQYGYSGPFPGSYSGPTTYDQDYACK